jgi:hypothetical protein
LAVLVLSQVDWGLFYETVIHANLAWILVNCCLYLPSIYLKSLRWRLLLRTQGVQISMASLMTSFWIGSFANNFLPSTVGADAFRAYDQGKKIQDLSTSGISVVVDRLVGLAGLTLLGVIASLALYPTLRMSGLDRALLLLIPVSSALLAAVFFPNAVFTMIPRLVREREVFDGFRAWADRQNRNRKLVAQALAVSLALHLLSALGGASVLYALRLEISLRQAIPILLYASVISAIPVSINSWGVREGAFVYLLGAVGIAQTQAVAAALFGRFLTMLLSLGGAALYLVERSDDDSEVAPG